MQLRSTMCVITVTRDNTNFSHTISNSNITQLDLGARAEAAKVQPKNV